MKLRRAVQRLVRRGFMWSAAGLLGLSAGCGRAEVSTTPEAQQAMASVQEASLQTEASATAGEWPRWRGPRIDGVSTETDWSNDWPEGGPPRLWETEVGVGFSSLAVADGSVYTLGREASPEGRDNGNDIVLRLDAKMGKEIWRHTYPCPLSDNNYEGGPNSTPTVDVDRVYTVSKEGDLFCLDAAKGKVLWHIKFADKLGVSTPEWGFSCSPLVLGDLVIVDGGRTAAFHKRSGELVWSTDKYAPGYGSPTVFWRDEKPWVAVLNGDGLLVVDPASGAEAAWFDWTWDVKVNTTTPIVMDDLIFISTAYDQGCALLRFTGDSLEEVYRNKEMANHVSTCVQVEGQVYGFDGMTNNSTAAQLKCLDMKSGEVRWAHREREGSLGCGSLIAAGDRLIVLSEDGELVIVRAAAEKYEELASAQILDGKCWTAPVLAGGKLYARNAGGRLVCFDLNPAGE